MNYSNKQVKQNEQLFYEPFFVHFQRLADFHASLMIFTLPPCLVPRSRSRVCHAAC
jgi:hypothetical protein